MSITLISFFSMAAIMLANTGHANNLERAKTFFDQLNKDQLHLVDQFYDSQVVFQDPIHTLNGASALKKYYEGLYRNVDEIRFVYGPSIEQGNTVSLTWRMHLQTPALQSGKELTVDGVSVITFGGTENKAIHHRDYFDMGEFVYERVPVLSSIITYIKKRMAN